METITTKLLIIGSGPAGYSAAIYGARASLDPVLVEGMQPGGQLTITTDVENYPGYADVIQGPWLMEQFKSQAQNVGTKLIRDHIKQVDFSKRPFKAIGSSGNEYIADSVVIATGAQAKWLGLPSEEKFKGYGVSGCATCDGFFYKGKKVAVIGGGNTAVEEALFLTNFADKVLLIHRRDSLRAESILQKRLFENKKIETVWNHALDEVLGEEKPLRSVTGMRLKNTQDNKLTSLDIDGIFIAIGHKPSTEVFKGHINMDDNGYILCENGTTRTDIAGVFAAGDVQDKIYRQAVTAAGQGCMAALDAQKYLSTL